MRHECIDAREAAVECAAVLQIAGERLILTHMPSIGMFLRETRAMTVHTLYQIVGHFQTSASPIGAATEVAPDQHTEDGDPGRQQRGVKRSAGANPEKSGGHHE